MASADSLARPASQVGELPTFDVRPVNKKDNRSLYRKRERIHPKRAHGFYRRLKWIVMAVTLTIYYALPWVRWDRGPNAPDQAVLLDLQGRRFYFFFIEIWPQEFYYVTGLLVMAALALFLTNSIAGRVWCGYTCPQTVWTDLFLVVERFFEGDRNARIKLDKQPWGLGKLRRKIPKHAVWIVLGLLTGGAWVFYFGDAPTLLRELVTLEAAPAAYITVAVLTGTTYLFGGFMREQVCTYMCPWPRIQGAMLDEDSMVVTYHAYRGEPRGRHIKAESPDRPPLGDCIDCNACVVVCPMGIDIRDGQQLECITCALCIDACNQVMGKLGRPLGLISYDTIANDRRRASGLPTKLRVIRPRTILYTFLWAAVGLGMLYVLATRSDLDVNVQHDRNPLFVVLSNGDIRNAYTVKILNKAREARTFELSLGGLPDASIDVVGLQAGAPATLEVESDRLRSFRVIVTAGPESISGSSTPIEIVVRDADGGASAREADQFQAPER
jgi:cytochrome c oxidase accessory protein FixG